MVEIGVRAATVSRSEKEVTRIPEPDVASSPVPSGSNHMSMLQPADGTHD